MPAPASSTHASRSLKRGTFIMMKVLDSFDEILRGEYRLTMVPLENLFELFKQLFKR